MNSAQAQYGQFGTTLPSTGINLTAIFVVSVLLIGAGLLAVYGARFGRG